MAVVAKDPLVNPAWHTRTNVYLLPLHPRNADDGRPRLLTTGSQGACACPVFSSKDAAPGSGGKKGKGKKGGKKAGAVGRGSVDGQPPKKDEPFKLEDVNFSVPRGQLCAVVGAVGTGKSSLLQGL